MLALSLRTLCSWSTISVFKNEISEWVGENFKVLLYGNFCGDIKEKETISDVNKCVLTGFQRGCG